MNVARFCKTLGIVGGVALVTLACGGSDASSQRADSVCKKSSALRAENAPRLLLSTAFLERLQERARSGDPAWASLSKTCDDYASGTIHAPNGQAYPGYPNIGQGYQGDEYLDPMLSLALCYRTSSGVDNEAATRYAGAGTRLLEAMSTPESSGGQRVSTNSGFGIRHYGVGMAIGYDWLYPALASAVRQRVIDSLNAWIDWYDANGFLRNDPIGNYFVGYLQAKTYAAIATTDDNPKAAGYWQDIEQRIWPDLVKAKFGTYLAGGGWPEGWGYGRRAVRGLAEFLLAAATGKNKPWISELPQVREQAEYVSYFSWPSLTRMDDQGTVRAGVSMTPSLSLVNTLATLLEQLGDEYAPIARAFAADLKSAGSDDLAAWDRFLYSDPAASQSSYTKRPLSYLAPGPGHVAMRSEWTKSAVWGSFTAGPYINAPASGEQMFNQGGFSIVTGGEPLIVNANGWISKIAGTAGERFVYDDAWTSHTRKIYNTFYVNDSSNLYNPGQNLSGPETAATHVDRYEDRVTYVRATGANIEDMYGWPAGNRPVQQFNRDLVYVRPGTFVLYDRTAISAASADQWLAFHVPTTPNAVTTTDASQRRFDVAGRGSLFTLLPEAASIQTATLPGGTVRIEAHAPAPAAEQTWLTVIRAGALTREATRLSAQDGNVPSGTMLGVHVQDESRDQVVLFPSDHDPSARVDRVEYRVAQANPGDHVLVDLQSASSGYAVDARAEPGALVVSVQPGGPYRTTEAGTLSFEVSPTGVVSEPAVDPGLERDESDPLGPTPAAGSGPEPGGNTGGSLDFGEQTDCD